MVTRRDCRNGAATSTVAEIGRDRLFRRRVAACRLDQKVVERLQKLGPENLDHRRFRPEALLLIGELHRMAEHRRQRRDIDAGRRETILERRIRDDSGSARHRLDALERHQRELRVRGRQALVSQQRIGDAPAIMQFSDQVFGRHDDIVEEYLAELVIARDRLDRPDPDAWAVQIDQQEADAGVPRLGLRIGAHQRVHPVRMMRPGGPDLVPPHHEMIARPALRGSKGWQGRSPRPARNSPAPRSLCRQ